MPMKDNTATEEPSPSLLRSAENAERKVKTVTGTNLSEKLEQKSSELETTRAIPSLRNSQSFGARLLAPEVSEMHAEESNHYTALTDNYEDEIPQALDSVRSKVASNQSLNEELSDFDEDRSLGRAKPRHWIKQNDDLVEEDLEDEEAVIE